MRGRKDRQPDDGKPEDGKTEDGDSRRAPDAEPGEVSGAGSSRVADAEQQASLERIEAGGIPLAAERRLRELGEHGGCYTSDLSVADFALCHQLGLRPLAQVMGSSIYQVGYQNTPWPMSAGGFMFELNFLSDAWNEVRRRALNRLALEAGHPQCGRGGGRRAAHQRARLGGKLDRVRRDRHRGASRQGPGRRCAIPGTRRS